MKPETLSPAEARRILVESLIDQWGEQSFPASDPHGRLPPSFTQRRNDVVSKAEKAWSCDIGIGDAIDGPVGRLFGSGNTGTEAPLRSRFVPTATQLLLGLRDGLADIAYGSSDGLDRRLRDRKTRLNHLLQPQSDSITRHERRAFHRGRGQKQRREL